MNPFRRILLVFLCILFLGWLSVQLSLYRHLGLAGILLPGLNFGLPFSLLNFESGRQRVRGVALFSLFATLAIAAAFLLLFVAGPEGAGMKGMAFGLMLGFCCAAPLTLMIYVAYGLSWPAALLAVGLGSILPALAGFEDAENASIRPEFFAALWLAVMGGVYTWGLGNGRNEGMME
ncbi:MAG: hypothetical protein KDD10_15895 [Phaeodactylibacter sp.]|nr:hypothetical protein [Phaeodactylibacter sp.]